MTKSLHATLLAAYNLTRTITGRTTTEPARLTLFVYGSLKRGFENHEVFCQDARYTGEAFVRGRLYDLPDGYPGLVVPGKSVRATGTADPVADAATQAGLDNAAASVPKMPGGEWDAVYGELLAFPEPGNHVPHIDRLEGFDPGGPSLYRRVLLPAMMGDSTVLAWTYVVETPSDVYLPSGRWPR